MSVSVSPPGAWPYCTTALTVWRGAQWWPPGNSCFPLGSITQTVACGREACSGHCCGVWMQRWMGQQHFWEMWIDEFPKKPQQELKQSVWSSSPTNSGDLRPIPICGNADIRGLLWKGHVYHMVGHIECYNIIVHILSFHWTIVELLLLSCWSSDWTYTTNIDENYFDC